MFCEIFRYLSIWVVSELNQNFHETYKLNESKFESFPCHGQSTSYCSSHFTLGPNFSAKLRTWCNHS